MKTHKNIPVFVVHEGCPHTCVFCSQGDITGAGTHKAELDKVRETVDEALTTVSPQTYTEIAFFGGSFTAIPRERMISLLECAHGYVADGKVNGIRLSTRPDCIDGEILDILKLYGVTAIELGIQSMDNAVLTASERGHDAAASRRAMALIRERNCFELVGQMMTGLPLSSAASELYTAEEIIAGGCTHARIYPTVVIGGTKLARMRDEGLYTPPDADDMLERCTAVLELFVKAKVGVIRLGLQDVEGMRDNEGYDSAFGERVRSRVYLNSAVRQIQTLGADRVDIFVPKKYISRMTGQKRENTEQLKKLCSYIKIRSDDALGEYEVRVERAAERSNET